MATRKTTIQTKQLAALYLRVSTDDQHSSIENQHGIFMRWIQDNNCELHDVYNDEGISGTKGAKRLDWLRLLQDGREKKYNILLAKSFSRFGRNQRETLDAIKDLRAAGIRVVFIEDNLDSTKDANNFGLFAWLAEQEAQRTSERLKLVWEKYNQDGVMHVCLPPYGYDYNIETKNYVVNYEESKWVEQIFAWYMEGYGFTKIANMLAHEGVKTKRGGTWANNTVRKMMSNEAYIGTLVQGLSKTIDVTMNEREKVDRENWYRHPNNHIPIISEDIFYKVQDLIQERSTKAKSSYLDVNKPRQNTRQSNASLYSNLLKCGECGSTVSVKRKKKFNYEPYYNCIAYDLKGKIGCGHSSNSVREDALCTIIRYYLEEIAQENFKKLKEIFKESKTKSKPKSVELELKTIESKIEQHLKLSMSLLMNQQKGLIGETQFKLQNEMIEKNLSVLIMRKEELEKLPKDTVRTNEESILIEGINKVLSLPDKEWTNSLLKTIIEHIVIFIDGRMNIKLKYLNNQNGNHGVSNLGNEYSDWMDKLISIPGLDDIKKVV